MSFERSFLFIAADDPQSARAAAASEADAVILDLEDLLPPARKRSGREALDAVLPLRSARQRWLVRINPVEGELAFDDLAAAIREGVAAVMVPKIERREQLAIVDWAMAGLERRAGLPVGSVEAIGIVETGAAFGGLGALAAGEPLRRRVRLGLGTGDLVKDLDLRPTEEETEIGHFRSALVAASRTAGFAAPIDCVWINVEDDEGLRRSAARGRSFGLQGKFCLTPRQAAVANAALSPSAAEIARAREVLRAYEAALGRGEGMILAEGEFIDGPIAERYRAILRQASGGAEA